MICTCIKDMQPANMAMVYAIRHMLLQKCCTLCIPADYSMSAVSLQLQNIISLPKAHPLQSPDTLPASVLVRVPPSCRCRWFWPRPHAGSPHHVRPRGGHGWRHHRGRDDVLRGEQRAHKAGRAQRPPPRHARVHVLQEVVRMACTG